jgi:dihydrofolate synthase/folylpolyglutamate synthase
MDYQQAQDYILGFTDYEKIPGIAYTAANYDLRRMEKLLAPLGNPHLGTKTIHIAGTKGKGSTAAMIAQALISSGFRTGLFTSPHLHTIRERVRIDNRLISKAEFASITTELKPVVRMVNQEAAFGQLTTFEILAALVFTYFNKNNVDFQVLEVGLGGRLDATNIASGDICVITSISLDHTEILGNSVAQIATEKAGIIKTGSIVVSSPQTKEAADVIEAICRQQKATLILVGKDITWQSTGNNYEYQSFIVNGMGGTYKLSIPLLGIHQLENAATAVATLEALNNLDIQIPISAITAGLKQVNWPGRLQLLQHNPLVVVDGAHNAYSMKKLVEAVQALFSYQKCHVIFGTSCDKDIYGMVQELEPIADNVTITSSTHPRAASASTIATEFKKYGINARVRSSLPKALSHVLGNSKKNDIVLITGSLFVVAEAIKSFQHDSTYQTPSR